MPDRCHPPRSHPKRLPPVLLVPIFGENSVIHHRDQRPASRARRATLLCQTAAAALPAAALLLPTSALATDQHFDYTSFETTFGQSQFNVLNYASINGNYMM